MIIVPKNIVTVDGKDRILKNHFVEIENGKILEPVNLDTFPVQLAEGKNIYITYTLTGGASICMVGDIVEIQTLKE